MTLTPYSHIHQVELVGYNYEAVNVCVRNYGRHINDIIHTCTHTHILSVILLLCMCVGVLIHGVIVRKAK